MNLPPPHKIIFTYSVPYLVLYFNKNMCAWHTEACKRGVSNLDAESVFFAPKKYTSTAKGQKTLKRVKYFTIK